jgi:hypothetical protein
MTLKIVHSGHRHSATKTCSLASSAAVVRTVSLVGGSSAQSTVVAPDYLLYGATIVADIALLALAYMLVKKK